MPGFNGTGPMGAGPMTGGGRGFCSPWGIGAAQRYGFPRWTGYAYPYHGPGLLFPGAGPFAPRMSREQETAFLKSEAESLREHLKELEARIEQLTTKSNKE
jgi:hypothetical protein